MTTPVGMAAVEQYMNSVEEKKENSADGSPATPKMRLVVTNNNEFTCWNWDERDVCDKIGAVIGDFIEQQTGIYLFGYSCNLKRVAEIAADQKIFHPEFAKLLNGYNDTHNHKIEAKTIQTIETDFKDYIEKNKQQILELFDVLRNILSYSEMDIERDFGLKISEDDAETVVIDFTGNFEDLQNLKERVKEKAAGQWVYICCWPDLRDREIRFRRFCEKQAFSVEDLAKIVEKSGRYMREPDQDSSMIEMESYKTPSIEHILGDVEKLKGILGDRFDAFRTAFEKQQGIEPQKMEKEEVLELARTHFKENKYCDLIVAHVEKRINKGILKDPEKYLYEWKIRRGEEENWRIPEDDARYFFKHQIFPEFLDPSDTASLLKKDALIVT